MNYFRSGVILFTLLISFYSCEKEDFDDDESIEAVKPQDKPAAKAISVHSSLDFGFYFVSSSARTYKAIDHNTNQIRPLSKSLYDPNRPTVIYFHGWQRSLNTSAILNGSSYGNITKAWKDKGWNVAIFVWDQFASESEVKDAEAKIHTHNGPKKMYYKTSAGDYYISKLKQSVTSLALAQYRVLFASQKNAIRFAGHSLGNQLASALGYEVARRHKSGTINNRYLIPNRLELLDPFWSRGSKSYLGQSNGKQTEMHVRYLIDHYKVLVTWYKSSAFSNIGVGDLNRSLSRYVAYQHNKFWYLGPPGLSTSIGSKHNEIIYTYYRSIAFTPPEEVDYAFPRRKKYSGEYTASASSSNARIRRMMTRKTEWRQTEGRRTRTPDDDQFEAFPKK